MVKNAAGSLAVITASLECLDGGERVVELPWLLHPTGMHVLGSVRAGCIVGNIILMVMWVGGLFLATWLLAVHRGSGFSMSGSHWSSAASYFRFPSSCSLVPCFFIAGTFDSSVQLLAGDSESMGQTAVAWIGIVYAALLYAWLWSCCREKTFTSFIRKLEYDPARKSASVEYIFGKSIWTSRSANHTERMGVIFENYSYRTDVRFSWVTQNGRYVLVEVGQILVLVAISAIKVNTFPACAAKAFTLCAFLAVLGIIAVLQRPFIAAFLNHIVTAMYLVSAVGMALFGFVFASSQNDSPLLLFAAFLLFGGLLCSFIRGGYDCMTYTMDLFNYNIKLRREKETQHFVECDFASDNKSDPSNYDVKVVEMRDASEYLSDGSEPGSPLQRAAFGLSSGRGSGRRLRGDSALRRSFGHISNTSLSPPQRRSGSFMRVSEQGTSENDDAESDIAASDFESSPRQAALLPPPTRGAGSPLSTFSPQHAVSPGGRRSLSFTRSGGGGGGGGNGSPHSPHSPHLSPHSPHSPHLTLTGSTSLPKSRLNDTTTSLNRTTGGLNSTRSIRTRYRQ